MCLIDRPWRIVRQRVVATMLLAFCFGLFASPTWAQVSPEEHKKHHPKGKGPSSGPGKKGPGGAGTPGKGGMGNMGGMMEKMGAPKPKDLYPSLMELPDLSPARRAELETLAQARIVAGGRRLGEGLDELSAAASRDDLPAMGKAAAKIRMGLSVLDSGVATRRALREGKAPRNVALQWFKHEMNLGGTVDAPDAKSDGLWGMAPLHTGIMGTLVLFAAAMIAMYFFKMRRAAALVHNLASAPATAGHKTSSTAKPSSEKGPRPKETTPNSDTDAAPADAAETTDDAGGFLPMVRKRKLCRLRLARRKQETPDVTTFRWVACHGGGIPFSYLPGQFLTFTLPVADKPIRRSYTISSAPTQGYYCEVSVKREDKGAGSRFLHDKLKVGDTVEVKAPSGRLTFTGKEAESIVLIGGGVGITPMMSVARAMTDIAWPGDIHFVVACADREHFIFEKELQRLQEQFDNFHLHAALSGIDKDIGEYRSGRLTAKLLSAWVPNIASQRVHLCGPGPMMDAVKAMLEELKVPATSVHTENFGAAKKPKRKAQSAKAAPVKQQSTGARVTFATSNEFTQLQPKETILEAAERLGVDIDNSCRVGACGICIKKLISGQVEMETDDGLEPEDREAGMILTCQARATEDVSIDA